MTQQISSSVQSMICIRLLASCQSAEERHTEILGQLLYTAKLIAKQEGLDDGFRIVINDGPNGCAPIRLSPSCSSPWRTSIELASRLMRRRARMFCEISTGSLYWHETSSLLIGDLEPVVNLW
ncbi:hypothetical protein GBA52_024865 [Prunus armeniaca]|nr:hypothetical protein GBA52_024865 [Prunus armeniaca]